MPSKNEPSNRDWTLSSAMHGMGLPDLLRILNRRRTLLMLCFACGIGLGVLYYTVAKYKYESSAQILVMKKDSNLAARGMEGRNEVESRVSEDLLATHMQILQSRQIVEQALKSHGYDQLPSIVDHLAYNEDPTSFVIDRLYVTRGGAGQAKVAHVLNVKFRHTSPVESQQILQAIIESYKAFLGEKFQDVSKEAASLISEAKVDLAVEMESAENAYQKFREQAPLLWNGDESANIHRVRYEELEAALSEIRLKTSQAKARLEVVSAAVLDQDARNAPDLERLALLDDTHIDRLSLLVEVDKGDANTAEFQATQPARLEGARAEHDSLLHLLLKENTLRTDLGPEHPQVQEVGRQIAIIRDFLKQKSAQLGGIEDKLKLTPRNLLHAYVGLLKHDLATLQKRQDGLEVLAATEAEEAKKLVSFELRGETMRKEVARKQALYDAVLDRLREINLVKDYGGIITEVIAPVELGEKVWPKLSLSLALGGLFGLVLGCCLVGMFELVDPMFHGIEEVGQALETVVLSRVPRLVTGAPAAAVPDSRMTAVLAAFHRPRSRESEVVRVLRTSLLFRINGAKHQLIAFTSPNPSDGKTTVVSNLAVSMAQAGYSVLLVDCDMRRPTVHKVFGCDAANGLAELVDGRVEPTEAIRTTEAANLSILPSGAIPANPAELLTSSKFVELLAWLRERYDYVLLDSPPLLAVADPCIIAQHTDGVVLTVRPSKDSRMQVQRSKQLLEAANARLLGAVVNAYDLKRQQLNSYEYGYGYGYGYESYGEDSEPEAAGKSQQLEKAGT
ncbi:MAG TPA: polysaccharide biosynthesis tyrosine autokinase [Pirellulales bacterium]